MTGHAVCIEFRNRFTRFMTGTTPVSTRSGSSSPLLEPARDATGMPRAAAGSTSAATTEIAELAETARLYGMELVDLRDVELDAELLALFPAADLFRHVMIPLGRRGNVIRIATSNPLDIEGLDELSSRTGLLLKPVLAARVRLKNSCGPDSASGPEHFAISPAASMKTTPPRSSMSSTMTSPARLGDQAGQRDPAGSGATAGQRHSLRTDGTGPGGSLSGRRRPPQATGPRGDSLLPARPSSAASRSWLG